MLNIPNLAAQWGKIFGGVNQFDTFRGTTAPARADTISALYVTAAQQRLAAEGLYNQMESVDSSLGSTVTYFFGLAKDTLSIAAQEDTNYPVNLDEDALLAKLIDDSVAQAQTFQLPTVQVGGASTAAATGVTTLLGAPFGNGTIVGTIINPRTGIARYYTYAETIRFKCTADSYTGGQTAGQEAFVIDTYASVDTSDSQWPKGSGVSLAAQSAPSSISTMFGNAYFDNWAVANTPDSWTVNGLVPGVTLFQTTDSYSGSYAAKFTAAPLNSELIQTLTGLTANQNYMAAIRVKRPGAVTGGVITVALRDQFDNILTNALGANLSFTVALTGAGGAYILTDALFSVPRGFATTVKLSIRFTTAMIAAESVEVDNVELIPMTSVYVGGPDIAFIPGSIGWAANDTLTLAATNTAGKASFVKLFDRLYNARVRGLDLPVAGSPTISDALIA